MSYYKYLFYYCHYIELVVVEKICNVRGNRGLKAIVCLTEKEGKVLDN